MGVKIQNWDAIKKNYSDSILFNLTLYSSSLIRGKDFEIGEYYLESEDIFAIKFYIDKLNENTTLTKVTLKVFSPDNREYCNITLLKNFTGTNDVFNIALKNQSFSFNKTGLWKIRLDFETDKKSQIWRYIGSIGSEENYQTFMPTEFKDNELEDLTFYNYYSEEIPVITLTDALQLQYARQMNVQSEYLNKSATAQNQSINEQRNLAYATVALAIVTLVMAIGVVLSALYTKQSVLENIREKKKESIVKIIILIIENASDEFTTLRAVLVHIFQNRFTTLPELFSITAINKYSWSDFEIECPDKYKEIKEYLAKKSEYITCRTECINQIKQSIMNKIQINRGILISLGRWAVRHRGTRAPRDYFEEYILASLIECVLLLENVGNPETIYLFTRYNDIWIAIREEQPVSARLLRLTGIAHELEKYTQLSESLKETKNDLMKKYVITNDFLENYRTSHRP